MTEFDSEIAFKLKRPYLIKIRKRTTDYALLQNNQFYQGTLEWWA